jgi:general secretion pathway protein J
MEDITRAQDFLRQRLGTIYPSEHGDLALSSPGFLISSGDALEFSGSAPHALDEGILRYQIALSRSEPGTLDVRFRRDRNGLPNAAFSDWSHERLLTRVAALSVQFFEMSPDSAGRWVDSWSDASRLPRLIRVDVSFAPNDARRWPPLYVEPRIDTNTSCVFDVVSRRCRGGV